MYIFGILWIPNPLAWLTVVCLALYIYGTWTHRKLAAYGYRGPKPWPFIGNMNLVFGNGFFGKWDATGKALYGKVFSLYEGRIPTIVVFDTAILKEVLVKQFSNFVDRRPLDLRGDVMSHSLLDLKGDEWRRMRNFTSPFFTTGKLRRNINLLESCCENLLKKCKEVEKKKIPMDVKEILGAFTLEAICLTAFGLDINTHDEPDHILPKTFTKMLKFDNLWGLYLSFMFPPAKHLLEKFGYDIWPAGSINTLRELTKIAIKEREKSHQERPDFIQSLIKASDAGTKEQEENTEGHIETVKHGEKIGLSEVEIVASVGLFALAGFDTTSTAMSFLLFSLANNPECQDKVVKEINDVIEKEITYDNLKQMKYLDMCIEETLRLYPPGLRTDRTCIKDTTINGYFIPKGTLVVIPIYGLHHDPELWQDPEKFDPERFSPENRVNNDPYAYHAFGIGPRNCVGMRLAQIEVKMATIRILQKYKISVSKKTKMPLRLAPGFNPKVEGGLYLQLEARE